MPKRKVAIFDIDGTLFRSSLLIEVTEALIHAGVFKQTVRNEYRRAYKRWSERKGTYEEYIWAVIHAFERHIKGVRSSDFKLRGAGATFASKLGSSPPVEP